MTKSDRHDSLIARLNAGIEALSDSAQWTVYLDMQQRLHRYSPSNVLLIISQRPDATNVAGFQAWKALGRTVRKGERAIWIVAPRIVRSRKEPGRDPSHTVAGFRPVAVFDISQTDGGELPSVCSKLTGGDPSRYFGGLVEVARVFGYLVQLSALDGGVNGDCAFDLRRIRVEARNSPAQQVKSMAHELVHALCHVDQADRALAELEAESAAFVICGHLGIETGAYSFGYVAIWAGGGQMATAAIKASCSRITGAADIVLASLEVHMAPVIQSAA
jgi:antirestriction protein ArdC